MSYSKVKVTDSHERLMVAIGDAVRTTTAQSPMELQAIVGVLAFCAGAAIARGGKSRTDRRHLKEMASANLEFGIEAVMGESERSSSLILPAHLQ